MGTAVVKVYFWGQELSYKVNATRRNRRSYLRHGLLFAVYAEVVKGHTLWHYVHCKVYANAVKNCNIAAKRSSKWYKCGIIYQTKFVSATCVGVFKSFLNSIHVSFFNVVF